MYHQLTFKTDVTIISKLSRRIDWLDDCSYTGSFSPEFEGEVTRYFTWKTAIGVSNDTINRHQDDINQNIDELHYKL